MEQKLQITASIVLYKEDPAILKKVVQDFLRIPCTKKLFLVSNSKKDNLESYVSNQEIECLSNDTNLGFGKGHNTILKDIDKLSKYHLILNADIEFEPQVIPKLIDQLEREESTSFITPKVLYPNGDMQFICRKHPSFVGLIQRFLGISKESIAVSEYRNRDLNKPFYPKFIHGCFMLFKTDHLIDLKGFDERFFLYMEDADICRRIQERGNKIKYYPLEKITHAHRKGSRKNVKLFFIHLFSAFKYFNKWGY